MGFTKLSNKLYCFPKLALIDLRGNKLASHESFHEIVEKFTDRHITLMIGSNSGIKFEDVLDMNLAGLKVIEGPPIKKEDHIFYPFYPFHID